MGDDRRWHWLRVPLKLQVGLVVALFVAALAALWSTWAQVVEREGRRSTTRVVLECACNCIVSAGCKSLPECSGTP